MKKIITLILLLITSITASKAQNPLVVSLLNDVRLDSLTNFVKQLTGEKSVKINGVTDTIKSRHYQNIGNEKAFQFMKQEFIRYGYQIDSFAFNTNGKNLFAIKTGYKYPNRKFMLGAHYDDLPGSGMAKGADDNASGTSAVLEAARIFKNYNFPFTIEFALWDEEEPGLLGSTAYVQTISSGNDTLLGYVNLDMIGWDGNNDSIADINTKNIANSAAFANKAQNCNSTYSIQLGIHILNPGEESSDHAAFWNSNYTAIGIGEEHHTDFYPYWHTQADSLAHFNLSFYKKCSKLAYATIADLALDTLNTIGIIEHNFSAEFKLFPNPTSGKINIKCNTIRGKEFVINLLDTFGRQFYSATIPAFSSSFVIDINKINLLNGVYFINIFTDNKNQTYKFIKY